MAFQRVAVMDQVPTGTVKVVDVGELEIALCNVAGAIFAIANVCTHDGGPLGEGFLVDGKVECPRHGAQFDVRTGTARTLPAVIGVPVFPVKVSGEDILVDVD
jgi:3-phenylpropionate/trans-cinnamate dioxygenase ferredoxin subunit